MPDISAYTGKLGRNLAAHLLRRTTYAPTSSLIDEFAEKTATEAVNELLVFQPISNKPVAPDLSVTWIDNETTPPGHIETDLRAYVIGWMTYNMHFDRSLRSSMILFLHQNWFVSGAEGMSQTLYDYLKLLEFYALGSYKTLAKKMCRDNRMLLYLDGHYNTGDSPNENYAREFLELFTIGKGAQIDVDNYTNYTEEDVKAAAKVLSGYRYQLDNSEKDPDTGIRYCRVNPPRHSGVDKVFSSCFGTSGITIPGSNTEEGMDMELELFVNMVFDQIATARNISRKLYRYFVHRTISDDVESDIIEPMAVALMTNNYNLSVVLSLLLQSRHFYGLDSSDYPNNVFGSMVKSPLELVLQTINFFGVSPFDYPGATPDSIWEGFYRTSLHKYFLPNAGFPFFKTATVAGYPAYYLAPLWDRNWFDNATITQRFFLGRCLVENKRLPFSKSAFRAQLNMVTWVRENIDDPSDAKAIVNFLTTYLFPLPPDEQRKNYFLYDVLLGSLSLESWSIAWNEYVSTGTTEVVKPCLESLVKALLSAQEYQLK